MTTITIIAIALKIFWLVSLIIAGVKFDKAYRQDNMKKMILYGIETIFCTVLFAW